MVQFRRYFFNFACTITSWEAHLTYFLAVTDSCTVSFSILKRSVKARCSDALLNIDSRWISWEAPRLRALSFLILCIVQLDLYFVLLNGAEISLPTECLYCLCNTAELPVILFLKHSSQREGVISGTTCRISITRAIVLAKAVAVGDLLALNRLPFIHPSHSFVLQMTDNVTQCSKAAC